MRAGPRRPRTRSGFDPAATETGTMNRDELLDLSKAAQGLTSLDPTLAESILAELRAEFAGSTDPFIRLRAIAAQIGAAEDAAARCALRQLRERFEAATLESDRDEILHAFSQSADEGWTAWLTRLSAAVSAFRHTHALRLWKQPFPFASWRLEAVAQLGRALQNMLQSRWDEAYDDTAFLAEQACLPDKSRARLITIVGQIDLWWFDMKDSARKRFDEATKLSPNDATILSTWGDYWLVLNKPDEAGEYHGRAIAADPHMAGGYTGLGDRFERDGKLDEAEKWYREAIRLAGGEAAGYGRLIRLLGRPERLEKREAEMLALARTCVEVDPETEFDTYLDIGSYYAQVGRYSEARSWYEKARALHDDWPRACTALADLSLDQRNEAEAEALWKKAIDADPRCPSGYIFLGRFYEDRQCWREALGIYSRFPARPRSWASFARAAVGRMHTKLEDYSEAERVLRAELRQDAPDDFALRGLEELAEDLYQRRRDAVSARRIYDEILNSLGENYRGSYHNRLGNMFLYLRRIPIGGRGVPEGYCCSARRGGVSP